MSENRSSKNVSRRAVLKNGVRTTLAGGALIGGSIGAVSAQTESDEWSIELIYRTKDHFLPVDVNCDSTTDREDHSFFLKDRIVSWPGDKVGYHIAETTARSAGLGPSDFQAAGEAAAETWASHADIDLVKDGADITVEFGSVDGPGSAVAVAFLAGHGNEIDNADIRLDVVHDWKLFDIQDDCPGVHDAEAFDVQGVLAHEFGHALGLGHEPDDFEEEEKTDPLLTMYPFTTKGWTAERSLAKGDIGGIENVYPA